VILTSCCGGSASAPATPPPPPPPPPPLAASLIQVSGSSPFVAGCSGSGQSGTLYAGTTVEPYLSINPLSTANLLAVWQQDRWSNGGAQGLLAATSFDGGHTWQHIKLPFSRCAGGNTSNGADYARASDPWVSFGPDGTAYSIAIAFDSGVLQAGSSSAVLVSRSLDSGQSWSAPVTLIRDGSGFFNDKESITADPGHPGYVYAVWDRLSASGGGPIWFSRSTDSGQSWQAARAIYDPGVSRQTLGNQIVVLPDGTLVDAFTLLDSTSSSNPATLRIIRSKDQGQTWSAAVLVADDLAVGTHNPATSQPVRDGADMASIAVGPSGKLAMVWQDARLSGGIYDGIFLTQSTDDGQTWTSPVQVNGDPMVQAFTPSVRYLADGTIGVTYYDFRPGGASASNLPTDVWLTRSVDGINWSEQQIVGPFNLLGAADAHGLFLGDYQGLATDGMAFVALFAQTTGSAGAPASAIFLLPASAGVRARVRYRSSPASAPFKMPSGSFAKRVQRQLERLRNRILHREVIPQPVATPPADSK